MEKEIELNYDREAFLNMVWEMRESQRLFFAGQRSILGSAKKLEAKVDAFIQKALHNAGTTSEAWEKRPPPIEQIGLF